MGFALHRHLRIKISARYAPRSVRTSFICVYSAGFPPSEVWQNDEYPACHTCAVMLCEPQFVRLVSDSGRGHGLGISC